MNGLRLLGQIQRSEIDFAAVEELIRHDVSFSHLLLTYLNSGAFHWATRIESIRQALLLLGSVELRRWVWLACLSGLGQGRPPALMTQVLMRGRFCEVITGCVDVSPGEADPFLVGTFSLLDAILQRPLQGILDDLNLSKHIRNVLLCTEGEARPMSLILQIVKAYEVGNWSVVEPVARRIGLSAEALNMCHLESLSWVDSVTLAEAKSGPESSSSTIDFRCVNKIPRLRSGPVPTPNTP